MENDLSAFQDITTKAAVETERRLGRPRPRLNPVLVGYLVAVVTCLVLTAFSTLTGNITASEWTIVIFTIVMGGGAYFVQRWRENVWIRTMIENENRIRRETLRN